VFYPGDWSQTKVIVNFFLTGRQPKQSKLSHGASIVSRTQHSLATDVDTTTVEFNWALFMEEVQK